MLQVFRSNHIEVLVELLAREIDLPETLPADPFEPVRVVVGSKGMERWLRHQLAQRLGGRICANVTFPFPAQVLAEALASLEGGAREPEPDLWRPEVLVWALLDILPGLVEQGGDALEGLPGDLIADPSGPAGAALFGLAWELANLVDRYVVFRPDMALSWSEGRGGKDLPEELAWQPRLWAALGEHLGGFNHAARRWRQALKKGGHGDRIFNQPLRIFGISSLPPAFLERLGAISQHDQVDLFVLSPSPRYWADLSQVGGARARDLRQEDRDTLSEQEDLRAGGGHPLLRSLGRVSRDLQLVLESLGDRYTDRRDCDLFVARERGSDAMAAGALHTLQADIRDLVDPTDPGEERVLSSALSPTDDTVQFHGCYSPIRQVEALHQTLLHLFQRDPELQPRDVLVMTPDIEAFAPLVGAIFEQGRERPLASASNPQEEGAPWVAGKDGPWGAAGAPKIPYRVAERSMRRTNPVAEVLLGALGLAAPGTRLSASAFLDLLAVEPFRKRFDITAPEVETAREWIQESGIRWAVDAADRAAHDQPALAQNTWRFGLERLALGVAMADRGDRLFDVDPDRAADPHGLVPFDGLEGGSVLLLGKVMDAWTTLIDEVSQLRGAKTLGDWLRRVLGDPNATAGSPAFAGTLGRLTDASGASAWLDARVRAALVELQDAAEQSGVTRELTVGAFAQALAGRFEVASGATSVQTGAVTFAAMVPFRSVPYRVICLLGMDEGAFPRNPGRLHFDLTHRKPRVGDRDPRDEDRHLLLEAILAARDHLLIFWNGRDVRTNERKAPAVPVGELREVIDSSFPATPERSASAALTREHPLQPFSPGNFMPGAPLSYNRLLMRGAACALNPERQAPVFFDPREEEPPCGDQPAKPVEEISLDELCRFFKNPPRYLLNRGLNLHLWDDVEVVEDREPVDPGQVDDGNITRALLAQALRQREAGAPGDEAADRGRACRRLRALGTLPLGEAGERALDTPLSITTSLLTAAEPWIGSAALPEPCQDRVSVNLELDLDDCLVRLGGHTDPLFRGDMLTLFKGEEACWSLSAPWIQQVALAAARPEVDGAAVLLRASISRGRVNVGKLRFRFMPGEASAVRRDGARALLTWMVELFRRGQRTQVPLLANTSYKMAYVVRNDAYNINKGKALRLEEVLAGSASHDESVIQRLNGAATSAHAAWLTTGFTPRGESLEVHNRQAFGGRIPFVDEDGPAGLSPDFIEASLRFWEPCLAGRETGKKVKPSWPSRLTGGGS